MSYNLLLDTNFSNINKHWKLTNCKYENGFLISNSSIYSIEQEIVLPDPTKLYFSIDYLCFDPNIKSICCGIFTESGKLEAIKRKPVIRKSKKLSVVDSTNTEKVKVMLIIEAKTDNTRIHISSPLLVDLIYQNKKGWPKHFLNDMLDYRYGYDYENIYEASEIKIDSKDFHSPYTKTEEGKIGILAQIVENDWFKISCDLKQDHIYLIKLDYEEINKYGEIFLSYGETTSIKLGEEQLYMIIKGDCESEIRLRMNNSEKLPYLLNLKHIMIVDITNLKIDEDDIPHLPFI